MSVNPGNGREEFSIEHVKRQLQAFSAIEPPQWLEGKLEAGIPAAIAGQPITHYTLPRWRGIRWVGAAAAVVISVSAVAWLGAPWGGHASSVVDANGSAGRVYATDHNSLRPADINLCDMNSLR